MKQFLVMGGYAGYVWPAVALTLVVLGLNTSLGAALVAAGAARCASAAAARTAEPI